MKSFLSNHDPELDSSIANTTNISHKDCTHDNVVYILDQFSTTFNSSLSANNLKSISILSDSLNNDDSNSYIFNGIFAESSCSKSKTPSTVICDPCELKRLLKTDILSPISLGSSYHSINESLSADSNQSNLTKSSAVTSIASEFCVICNDLATGKHYGISACEGCKGFFKRTIRKNLHYVCRERDSCPITERLRNRCQSCRFNKCLKKGMKIEAVQKERILKQRSHSPQTNYDNAVVTITAEDILQNEMLFYCVNDSGVVTLENVDVQQTKHLCSIINKQLIHLVMWAKSVPGFNVLERSDQMILLKKSWVEILISSFSFRSSIEPDFSSIKMDDTHRLTLSMSAELGLQSFVIRILRELIIALKHLQVDQMEMACLKTIILFDSNYSNLKNTGLIKQFRYSIFEILKKYVSDKYPKQPSRIYKLLLKLPSIRGLTICFIERMKAILFGNLTSDNLLISCSLTPSNIGDIDEQSKPDFLYPLLSEMMKQKDYPYI